ncbi:acyltransferase family protein [Streptomyces sp. NBC_00557]|nr:acyltransferase family protein [Streptomyces sp. NBC_00557]WUC36967.1 acyltransferase family protein [Streptomyces sp. NBC_00557]
MFDAAPSPGQNRRPLPPAQSPAAGVPGPRTPMSAQEGPAKADRPGEKPGTRQPAGKQRDAFFDNAKYLAIVLVAMGHSWEPLKGDSRILEAVYTVVYCFHMPAFIIISGYFSRSFDMRPDRLKRLITGVVVPYVLFETAYPTFKNLITGSHEEISLLDPWYLTWFLVALFVWRLTTPIWKLVRSPFAVALGIAMLASVTPNIGDDLDLQRVLQFLPYFVLGLCMKPEHFQRVRRRSVRIAAVPVFAAALVVGWWAVPRMNTAWFYHRDAAQELGAPWWCGPVMTLALMGCSLLLTACFYSWVPRRRTWFTALGAGTLYGYLLHGFLVKFADYRGLFDHAWLHRPLGEILVTLLAGAAVTVLCTKPVQRVFRFAMEPRMEWAFKQDAAEVARRRGQQEREREKVSA